MRRHLQTLYPHPEQAAEALDDVGEDETLVSGQWVTNVPSYASPTASSSTMSSSKSRLKPLSPPPFSLSASSSTLSSNPSGGLPYKYSDIYSQFVRRYRSEPHANDELRDDGTYFRGLTDFLDGVESDSSSWDGHIVDTRDVLTLSHHEPEVVEPITLEDRERLEWQSMLTSVLDGDVLKSEKSRLQDTLGSSSDASARNLNIWLGIRAKLRGRKVEEEKRSLEERRIHVVDMVLRDIKNFHVDKGPTAREPLMQVHALLRRLEGIQGLYPNYKAFIQDKPLAAEPEFQAICDALCAWSTVLTSLRQQIDLLRKWTGSETLDVTAKNTNSEWSLGFRDDGLPNHAKQRAPIDASNFVERVLKEETIQRTFEKGFLVTVHELIARARDTQVNLAPLFSQLGLPTFEAELVQLISFPTRLVHACLHLRLEYASRVLEPDVLVIDQMLEDFRLTIGLACTLKRQYEAFLYPDPGGNWNPPSCINKDYDTTVLESLTAFFKLINRKVELSSRDIYFNETDVLEAQWTTFNDVSSIITGGSSLIAEQICALSNRLLGRATNNLQRQIRVPMSGKSQTNTPFTPPRQPQNLALNGLSYDIPARPNENAAKNKPMTAEQMISWYGTVFEIVKVRYRKLQRFSRALSQRFSNSAEFKLDDIPIDRFVAALVATDHFLVYTRSFEEEGTYIIASRGLRNRPDVIKQLLLDAFHVEDLWEGGYPVARQSPVETPSEVEEEESDTEEYDDCAYLLIVSPRTRFLWNGLVLMLPLPHVDFDLKDSRVRLVSDGSQAQGRLLMAKQRFLETFLPPEDYPEDIEPYFPAFVAVADHTAHLPSVQRELKNIVRTTNLLAEVIVESVHHIRKALTGVQGCFELLESWYSLAAEHGQLAQKHMTRKFNRRLIRLAISWVAFICDDCDPTDRRIFRWAVSALEFTLSCTKRNNILFLPEDQFELLRQKVASCMSLLISHFDILGARSNLEAKRERERQEELRQQAIEAGKTAQEDDELLKTQFPEGEDGGRLSPSSAAAAGSRSIRRHREEVMQALGTLDEKRSGIGMEQHMIGRVLDSEKPEDQSLLYLATSMSNLTIRWQQGKFIGAGAFGSVYMAVNLDSGSIMAVKEIRVTDVAGSPNLVKQIAEELRVMEMLHHPNVVEYYGIEVHRDKVYIFEEFCEGGSLAANLEVGRIADEHILQVYTTQMLEGLSYLHSKGIIHRDIKPDNILLDHRGVLKFVDFGAAKIIARNSRTMQRSRVAGTAPANPSLGVFGGGLGMNSLTGTPMYMSPEVIKNDKRGRHGAMDIWSMGCVVLECATGRKPWSNLDNEWAIMFHIGVATQHPPLPEKGELGELGINFIKQCLTIDPMLRPTSVELMEHPWILQFMETLRRYEEEEMANPSVAVQS